MLLFFFFNLRLIPKEIHAPFNFRENSSSFDFRENPCKTPKENKKKCFFFVPYAFWICSRHRPHSISRKIHPCLVSEKIHAKPPRKTKKIAFFLLPVLSRSILRVNFQESSSSFDCRGVGKRK